MKKISIFLIIIVVLASCRKDDPPPSIEDTTTPICYEPCQNGETFLKVLDSNISYTYNSSGNLISHVFNNDKRTYSYSNDTLLSSTLINAFDSYYDLYYSSNDPGLLYHNYGGSIGYGPIDDSIEILSTEKMSKYHYYNLESTFHYDSNGKLETIIDSVGKYVYTLTYNSNNQLTEVNSETYDSGQVDRLYQFEYDSLGRWVKTIQQNGSYFGFELQYFYDVDGKLFASHIQYLNSEYTFYYCQCGDGPINDLNPIYFFQHPSRFRGGMWHEFEFIGEVF